MRKPGCLSTRHARDPGSLPGNVAVSGGDFCTLDLLLLLLLLLLIIEVKIT